MGNASALKNCVVEIAWMKWRKECGGKCIKDCGNGEEKLCGGEVVVQIPRWKSCHGNRDVLICKCGPGIMENSRFVHINVEMWK